MPYNAFLQITNQFSTKNKASAIIDDALIFFKKNKKNQWILSTKVSTSNFSYCLSSLGLLRWQSKGPYLELDPLTQSIFLIEEIEMQEGKYIPFRHNLNNFSKIAAEWREILK